MTPIEHLHSVGRKHSYAWPLVEMLLQDKGKDIPDWPDWCFIPMSGWHAILSSQRGGARLGLDSIAELAVLSALGTWRYSQGLYRFDPSVYDAVIDTPLTGDIPADVFFRLPEWCMYIETPGLEWDKIAIDGFWVHLDWQPDNDGNEKRRELRFLLHAGEDLHVMLVHLGKWSLDEAIERTLAESKAQAAQFNTSHLLPNDLGGVWRPVLSKMIALVLYICSDEPDIDDERQPGSFPERPTYTKTKKGFRLFPADKPRVWTVGIEKGRELRATMIYEPDGRTVKPHLRRAHWHGFWKGPRDGEQQFFYKWLPPMVVGSKP